MDKQINNKKPISNDDMINYNKYNVKLLNNFIKYYKGDIPDNNYNELFSKMLVYENYPVCGDILTDVFQITLKDVITKKHNYEFIHVNYEKLPEKAFYIDKNKIKPETNILFVDKKNLLKIIILFCNDKNTKIVNHFLDMEILFTQFMKDYDSVNEDDIQSCMDKIIDLEIKVDKYKTILKEIKIKKQESREKMMIAKQIFKEQLNKIDETSHESEELDKYIDSKCKEYESYKVQNMEQIKIC